TRTGVNGPSTDQSAAMSTPNAPYPRSVSHSLKSSPTRADAPPESLVSQKTPCRSKKLTATCTTAAAANGPMMPGKELCPGVPTCPPNAMKARPARYALSAYMPVLNNRWTTDGPRRMPSSVPQLTSTAPTGPHSTTAASDAMVLADHASPRAFSKVAEDSQATKSRPSTAIWLQLSPAYGPLASTITAAAITAPI